MKINIFKYFTIVFLAICFLFIIDWFLNWKFIQAIMRRNLAYYPVENFDDYKPIFNANVRNNAKVNAMYEYDEDTDESKIQFNVNIPQNFMTSQTSDMVSLYQIKGFCNALNATSETIQSKCSTLDMSECANTSCCVLFGNKCVAGDERGPTYESLYGDPNIKYKDRYYYMGKCYGNCSNYMANDYDRIYTPSQITMGDVLNFTTTTPQVQTFPTTPSYISSTTTPSYISSTTTPSYISSTTTPSYVSSTTTPSYVSSTTATNQNSNSQTTSTTRVKPT